MGLTRTHAGFPFHYYLLGGDDLLQLRYIRVSTFGLFSFIWGIAPIQSDWSSLSCDQGLDFGDGELM